MYRADSDEQFYSGISEDETKSTKRKVFARFNLDRNKDCNTRYEVAPAKLLRTADPNQHAVMCQVCGFQIQIPVVTCLTAVRCTECLEATPIAPAPLRKRYVRCACNCLLLCKDQSLKVTCSRHNCNKILMVLTNKDDKLITDIKSKDETLDLIIKGNNLMIVSPRRNYLQNKTENTEDIIGKDYKISVDCCKCEYKFGMNTKPPCQVKCPKCNVLTAVGLRSKMQKSVKDFFFAVLITLVALITSVTLAKQLSLHIYPTSCYLFSVVLFIKGVHSCMIPVSNYNINEPQKE